MTSYLILSTILPRFLGLLLVFVTLTIDLLTPQLGRQTKHLVA